MNRNDIGCLLAGAMRITMHRDYVIIGSLSVLGAAGTPPDSMTGSIDVDLYPKNDPGRAYEIAAQLGLGSEFEQRYGYYADAVSPMLPTLPEGWEQRLLRVEFESGAAAWFLDPNDAAISKYVRSEPRDRKWIRAGLQAGILSLPTIEIPFTRNDHGSRGARADESSHPRRPQVAHFRSIRHDQART